MISQIKSLNKYILYSAVIIAAILLIMLIGRITTQVIKKVFINAVSSTLDKKVEIDGKFKINYSFSPSLHISDLKIVNREKWNQREFVKIGNAFIKLELYPLILNRIYIEEINISDVVINLEKDADGNKNWEKAQETGKQGGPFNLPGDIAVNKLLLTNILINYNNLESNSEENFKISKVLLSLPKDNNVKVHLLGSYLDYPVELKLTGGSYQEVKDPELYWPFNIYGNLVSSDLNASGKFKNFLNPYDLDLSVNLNCKEFDLHPVFNILSHIYKESFSNYKGNIDSLDLEVTGLNKDAEEYLKLSSANISLTNLNILKLNSKNNNFEEYINLISGGINVNDNEKSHLSIAGTLTGYPLRINADGCNKSLYFKGENCNIDLDAVYGNSDITISGFINRSGKDIYGTIKTKINIPDIQQYEFLFDVPEGFVIPAKASFEFTKNRSEISFRKINIKLGQSDLSGKLEKRYINNRPNYNISLFSNKLNINEIMAVLPKHDDDKDSDYSLKLEIFPNNLSIYDATTKIDLNNVLYHNLLIDKFFVNSRIKDNIETSSEFVLRSANGDFKGIYDLNLAPDLPVAKFKIKSRNVDLGKIAHDLGFAEDVNFKTKNLDLELNIVGSTLEEILLNSSLTADSKDGEYIVKDINTDSNFEIFVNSAHLELFAHKPIVIRYDGVINEQDVKITLEAKHIIRSISALERGKVPIKIKMEFADTNIIIEGFAVFPFDRKTSEIRITVKGKKLSDFNRLLGVDFPDKGPYKLTTDLNVTDQGYNLKNIDFDYASTELTGFLNIVTSGPKPYFDIKINAEVLNIDDLFSSRIKVKTGKNTDKKQDPSGDDAKIPELNSFDADFDFSISKIILSDEEIGDFEYTGKIINGKLLSNNALLNILGGEAEFIINVLEDNNEFKITLDGFLDNFNYSPIAKMINPESLSEGIMDLVVNIESRGTTFAELDDNLDGEIKIRIVPTLMDAGLVNIWALGLFNNLIPIFTRNEKEAPKVNCIIGKFKAKDGILRPDNFKIDTTNVRIGVVGKINLNNQKINLVFRPVAKKTQLINLGIPIRVVGTFEDHHVITDPYNLGWYILSYTYSLSTYIFEKITGNYKPEDGSDICNREIIEIKEVRLQ